MNGYVIKYSDGSYYTERGWFRAGDKECTMELVNADIFSDKSQAEYYAGEVDGEVVMVDIIESE